MGVSIRERRDSGKAPWFTAVHLENWRNFVRVEVKLERRVFLVGPNASGKSNFLDIFRFLHDIVSIGGGFQESVRRRGGVSSLRSLSARRFSDVLVSVEVSDTNGRAPWRYFLKFTQDSQRRALIREERVERGDEQLLSRPNDDDKADPERMTQTYLEQVNVNRRFRELAEFLGSAKYLHLVPQLVREPDRSVGRTNDPYGGDFLEQVARTQEKTRNARLRRILEALRVAVPQLQELELVRDEGGASHIRGKYAHWRPQGAWQTEEQFSDGTLRLMGLLWATLDGVGPLLLEEPELSLHPEVVRFLPQMFARVQRRTGRQVMISTHSPDLLRDEGIGLDEVLLLVPGTEGTAIERASDLSDVTTLLGGGVSLADSVMPFTRPTQAEQLALFGDL
jgi:predicted ATPase